MAQYTGIKKTYRRAPLFNKREFIKALNIFRGLNERQIDYLEEHMELKNAPRFQYIYMMGERATHIYFMVEGSVKIGSHSDDGREIIKTVIHPNSMFGEMSIIRQEARNEFACALSSNVKYLAVHLNDFQKIMETNFRMTATIMKMIGKRLQRVENRLESMVFKDARSRIIDFIRDNAAQRGHRVGFETLFRHSLTQQDIANITGTSRQTVTSVLNELKKSNLIYFNRKSILIRDLATLA